jgi:hypothetical protein
MKAVKVIVGAAIAAAAVISATAHAAPAVGDLCKGVAVGSATANGTQMLACVKEKWQDVATLPAMSYVISVVDVKTNRREQLITGNGRVGLTHTSQLGDEHRGLLIVSTVLAINSDHKAQVVVDLANDGWSEHVESLVPLDAETTVATDDHGREYRLIVRRDAS